LADLFGIVVAVVWIGAFLAVGAAVLYQAFWRDVSTKPLSRKEKRATAIRLTKAVEHKK